MLLRIALCTRLYGARPNANVNVKQGRGEVLTQLPGPKEVAVAVAATAEEPASPAKPAQDAMEESEPVVTSENTSENPADKSAAPSSEPADLAEPIKEEEDLPAEGEGAAVATTEAGGEGGEGKEAVKSEEAVEAGKGSAGEGEEAVKGVGKSNGGGKGGAFPRKGKGRGAKGRGRDTGGPLTDEDVYRRDISWLRSAHGMVAEV